MLIVTKNGERIVNSDNCSKIYVGGIAGNCVRADSMDAGTCTLGNYLNSEMARTAVHMIAEGFEAGKEIFHMPDNLTVQDRLRQKDDGRGTL